MHNSLKRRERSMGRTPIHDEAMSAAERQRRRRARLRAEPWRDQRRVVRAILQALRDLQGEGEGDGRLDPNVVAQIRERAVAHMELEDAAAAAAAREMVAKLLDPAEPLPERGHRGRRARRGHRFGDRMRRHHGRGTGDREGEERDTD